MRKERIEVNGNKNILKSRNKSNNMNLFSFDFNNEFPTFLRFNFKIRKQ